MKKNLKKVFVVFLSALLITSQLASVTYADEVPQEVAEAIVEGVEEVKEATEPVEEVINDDVTEEVDKEISEKKENKETEEPEEVIDEDTIDGEILNDGIGEDGEEEDEETPLASPSEAELEDEEILEATPSEAKTFKWMDGGFRITVEVPEGAYDAEDELSLKVVRIVAEELDALVEKVLGEETEEKPEAVAFDVSILANGEEKEPALPIDIKLEKVSKVIDASEEINVFHFTDADNFEQVPTEKGEEEDSLGMTLESLSPLLLLGSGSSIGDLWPTDYAKDSDLFSGTQGQGTEAAPYEIKSVLDLRAFAAGVASDTGKASAYYMIEAGTYDLGGTWIPVGFPKNAGGDYIPFSGSIYAEEGTIIKNLGFGASSTVSAEVVEKIQAQKYLGFFGMTDGAVITDLAVQTSNNTIAGGTTEAAGILIGYAKDSTIKECSVTGSVKGRNYVGGLAGYADSCHIEDSYAGQLKGAGTGSVKLSVYTTEAKNLSSIDNAEVGGLVGHAYNSSIVDTYVATTDTKAIYGTDANVGGVVGVQEDSDIYNAFVEQGNIGSSDSYAVGGITGAYNGGDIHVARMSATIVTPSSGSNYSGAFIGNRIAGAGFTYGESGNIAYLFADTAEKAKSGICGARVAEDFAFTYDAHIGYWHSADNFYSLVAGASHKDSTDLFYEELERGIVNVKTQASGDAANTINHFACNAQGRPVRGYLVAVLDPYVSSTKVATITAYNNGTYRTEVTSEVLGAFPEGTDVRISITQPQGSHYVLDSGKTDNPYYNYYEHDNYKVFADDPTEEGVASDGGYHLTMPSSDITVTADYVWIADTLQINPAKIVLELTQTRTGKRDAADVAWSVTAKNGNNVIIDDAIGNHFNNKQISTSIPLNFYVSTLVNDVANKDVTVGFTVNNTAGSNVISTVTAQDNTTYGKVGYFNINLTGSAIETKINELVQAQKDDGYRNSITTSAPYYYNALVTGQALTDAHGTPITDGAISYTDITVKLNIVDNTTVSLTDVALDKPTLTYNVVRTLSGDRKNPTVAYTVTGGDGADQLKNSVSATFNPDYFTKKDVHWYLSDNTTGTVTSDYDKVDNGTIKVAVNGSDYHYADISLVGITATTATNAFIADKINDDYNNYQSKCFKVPDTVYTYVWGVKVSGEDQENPTKTAVCTVTMNYHTIDNTEIMPETLAITGVNGDGWALTNKASINGYAITYNYLTGVNSNIATRKITLRDVGTTEITGGNGGTVQATLTPEYDPEADERYKKYNNKIVYSIINKDTSSGFDVSSAVKINPDTGAITVRGYGSSTSASSDECSPWVQSLLAQGRLEGSQQFTLIARSARDNAVVDSQDFTITFKANVNAKVTFNGNGATSGSTAPVTCVNNTPTTLTANGFSKSGSYAFSCWNTAANGTGTRYDNGASIKTLNDITLYAIWTYTGKSGGGGGGGGGGGSSSSSGSAGGGGGGNGGPGAGDVSVQVSNPAKGAVLGKWSYNQYTDKWRFEGNNGHRYANEWAYVHNPTAAPGLPQYDWFYFLPDESMFEGWYADPRDGQTYYLSPVKDSRRGHMEVGLVALPDGIYYFFNTSGALMRNYKAADGSVRTNAAGQVLNANGTVKRVGQ